MNSYPGKTQNEIELKGTPASPGRAMGRVKKYQKKELEIETSKITKADVLDHINKFKKARSQTESELRLLYNEDLKEETIDIINAQIEMVNDPELSNQIEELIKEDLYPVDFAIKKAFEHYIDLISTAQNRQTRERSIDVTDTRDRLLQFVREEEPDDVGISKDCILITKDLSPREVIGLMGRKIKGIILDRGGVTSHTAIIARSIGIPMVAGTRWATEAISENDTVAMDGSSGNVFVHPSEETVATFEEAIKKSTEQQKKYEEVLDKESVTSDGRAFYLRANIEFEEELEQVRQMNAKGIGLLRTESFYLEQQHFEDLRKQEVFYGSILEGAGSHPVTIRLLDAGGDKVITGKTNEQNPFLGWRGIRMLLDEKELLRDQLRAVLSVAGHYPGRVRILVPMVSVVDEILELKEEFETVQKNLEEVGKAIDHDVKLGIMVEVPSVALQADKFFPLVDFVSIGTNDLTQYVLAVDRGNELIADLYDQQHPAVWKLIRLTSEAAHLHGKDIAVCGELASNPVAAACLIGMGINELSMSPSRIPYVKQLLTKKSFEEMEKLSEEIQNCTTSKDVDELFNAFI